MTKRVTKKIMSQAQTLSATINVPSDGIDVSAYEEAAIFLKMDVDAGTWTVTVESYDQVDTWHTIKDEFGVTTSTAYNSTGDDQVGFWQLKNMGKHIRLKFVGVGGSQSVLVDQLIFLGKS